MIHPNRIILAVSASVALVIGLFPIAASAQPDGHAHEDHHDGGHAQHGGQVAKSARYHFEVVFEENSLRVYSRGERLTPEAAAGLKAWTFFLLPGATSYTELDSLRPIGASPGRPSSALALNADLSQIPTEGTKVTFQVWKLPDPAEPKAKFTVPIALHASVGIWTVKVTEADKLGVNAQDTCPISGEDLNTMGGPIEISRAGKSVFVCCPACIDAVKADAENYLSPSPAGGRGEGNPAGHDHGTHDHGG